MDDFLSAQKVLEENRFCSLATIDRYFRPWISPLYYASDDKLNIYWYSRKDARHSLNIQEVPTVAFSVFAARTVNDECFAVFIEGVVHELTKKELPAALDIYFSKDAKSHKASMQELKAAEDFIGSSPLRMYKLEPEKIYTSFESTLWHGKWLDTRKEIEL